MADFLKTKLSTDPTPVKVTVKPVVVGSTQIQLQLQPLPEIKITSTPEGSGWQKFNASVSGHMITTVGNFLLGFAEPVLQKVAQEYLNEKASFGVPPIPISVEGITVNLTASDLNIATNDDHVMVTGSVNVS